jgi:hypothetical protein
MHISDIILIRINKDYYLRQDLGIPQQVKNFTIARFAISILAVSILVDSNFL